MIITSKMTNNNCFKQVVIFYLTSSLCGLYWHYCYSSDIEKFEKLHFILVALLPIHDDNDEEYTFGTQMQTECYGKIDEKTIQNLEAICLAGDEITSKDGILPNVNLTIIVKDYCGVYLLALLQMANFIMERCSFEEKDVTSKILSPCYKKETLSHFLGVIYPKYQHIYELTHVLQMISVPMIGYSDAEKLRPTNERNDTDRIFNTISTGNHGFITEIMIEILAKSNYTLAAFHYSSKLNSDQNERFNHLEKGDQKSNSGADICITSINHVLSAKNESVAPYYYQNAHAIICFCADEDIIKLGQILEQFNGTKNYIIFAGYEDKISATLKSRWKSRTANLYYVSPKQTRVPKFEDYYTSLTPDNNTRNPWFKKFWEQHFNCTLNPEHETTKPKCNGTETLKNNYEQNSKVASVTKAVYALAHSLNKTLSNSKSKTETLNFTYELRTNLNKIDFTLNGDHVRFTETGFPNSEIYDVQHIEQSEDGNNIISVGWYFNSIHELYEENYIIKKNLWPTNKNKQLKMEGDLIQKSGFPRNMQNTSCYKNCSERQAQRKLDACCYKCTECNTTQYLSEDKESCKTCDDFHTSISNRTVCIPMPVQYDDIQSVISMIVSAILIITTLFVISVFIKYADTPAVKSTTKELSYIIFAGIVVTNITPFIPILSQNRLVCAVRVIPAIGLTMIHGALLVKTNRIARLLAISKNKFPNMNPKFMSLKVQVIVTFILIGIESLICLYSLYNHESKTHKLQGNGNKVSEICSLDGHIFIETFVFVSLLVLLCTYYAFRTRNLPENFNETKCICFAMYTTLLTEIASITIYFADKKHQILAVNLSSTIDSAVILIFLYSPKLYIILWKPEKNTRVNFTTKSSIRSYIGKRERTIS